MSAKEKEFDLNCTLDKIMEDILKLENIKVDNNVLVKADFGIREFFRSNISPGKLNYCVIGNDFYDLAPPFSTERSRWNHTEITILCFNENRFYEGKLFFYEVKLFFRSNFYNKLEGELTMVNTNSFQKMFVKSCTIYEDFCQTELVFRDNRFNLKYNNNDHKVIDFLKNLQVIIF